MSVVYLLVVLLFGSVSAVNRYGDDNGDRENEHCVCVPYWQCKEDYSGLVEDGGEVMDVRMSSPDYDPPCSNDFDVCCPIECGNRKYSYNDILAAKEFDEEIFGFRLLGENNEAEFAEFPWILGILEGRTYRCGASLIHPQVAVTAAHCVSKTSAHYIVRAGEWNWEASTEPLPHQDQPVKKVIIHPSFHPSSLRNDIAIIIVKSPFKLTENIGIICLPYQGMRFETNRCVAAGWGKNSHKKGTYQATLKKLNLPMVPRNRCLKTLQEVRLGPFFNLHKSFICAGEDKKDTCKGDGGSPLMCPVVGLPGKYHQVGIVSWGLTCGLQNTPGVYVNVALFIDWIDSMMRKHGFGTTVYKYKLK